jgi:hypothetical protein
VSTSAPGAGRLARELSRAGHELADNATVNAQAAARLAARAARSAPRRTGRLAGAHRPSADAARAEVAVPLAYARPIHNGVGPRTGQRGPHNITGRPWLADSLAATQGQVVALYAAKVSAVVRGVAGVY